jgi:PhnB protein
VAVEISPYLYPRGDVREALETYRRALRGSEPEVTTYGQIGMPDPASADLVANAMLRSEVVGVLMVSDYPPGMPEEQRPAAGGLAVWGDDGPMLEAAWEVLSEGAEVHEPLSPSPWGTRFGTLTDRWGVSWMFDVAAPATA